MRIFLTGDTHGQFNKQKLSSQRWPIEKILTKEDYLIILGDFGVIWKNVPDKIEKHLIKWYDSKSWTTLFIDGNHENHFRLSKLEEVNMFGDKVGKVSDSIFHLKRGRVYKIGTDKFFTMGGGNSIDKNQRREFYSWWKEEIPSYAEMDLGLENLKKNNNKVDYILTHTAPQSIVENSLKFTLKIKDITQDYLEEVINKIEFKKLYFAHFHINANFGKYITLYDEIVELKKKNNR